MYNGKFSQNLEATISCNNHQDCLRIAAVIKKQCEAWDFCVSYTESKSARKGDVLSRSLMIYQISYASDILIFKEAIRILCFHFNLHNDIEVVFHDQGAEPINDLRQRY